MMLTLVWRIWRKSTEFLLQRGIARARILQKRGTLRRRAFQGCLIQV
jgi:hypothetical protein